MSIDIVRASAAAPASESAGLPQRPGTPAASSAPPDAPEKVLVEMLMTGGTQQAICAAAVLRVADSLAHGPMEVEEIARRTGAHDALGDTVYPLAFARSGQLPARHMPICGAERIRATGHGHRR